MKLRSLLLTSAAVIIALPVQGVHAQESDQVFDLGTIVVTARRQPETLLETPVSVTVVEEEELNTANVSTLEDASLRTPNVFFNEQGGPLSIRGISSLGIAGGVDRQPAVGVFLDSVYLARPLSYPTFIEDLEQVEIVRGSQATTYGKNTIGGAVNLTSRSPGDQPAGAFTLGLSEDKGVNAQLSYEGPLSDSFAARATLAWRRSNGYITNTATNETVSDTDNLFGRIVVEGELASGTHLRFTADYQDDDSDGGLWFAPVDDALAFRAEHDYDPEQSLKSGGIGLRVDHDFGAVELTSITGYRGYNYDHFLDGDFAVMPFALVQGQTDRQRQFSQEFRLSSTGDRVFDWRAGAFYMYEAFEAAQFYDLESVPRNLMSRGTFDQTNDTIAAYATFDWEVAPTWSVSGGLRYSYDKKSTVSEFSSPSGTNFFGPAGKASADQSFDNWSPELTLTWEPNSYSLAFARVFQGHKSGGISPFIEADGSANTYDPETATGGEIGYRMTSADGRFYFSAAAFYTKWDDQQVVTYVTPVTRVIRNAAKSQTKGIELEASMQVSDMLRLVGGYGYTKARFDDFTDPILGEDYSGNPIPYAPEHSAHLGVRWDQELANGMNLSAGLDYTYRGSFSFNPDNAYRQPASHIFDVRVALAKDNWIATLYGKNLTDERVLTQYFDFNGVGTGVAAPGRTIGFEVTRGF